MLEKKKYYNCNSLTVFFLSLLKLMFTIWLTTGSAIPMILIMINHFVSKELSVLTNILVELCF